MEAIDKALSRINRWELTQEDMDNIDTSKRGVCEMCDEGGVMSETDTVNGKQERRRRVYRLGGVRIG